MGRSAKRAITIVAAAALPLGAAIADPIPLQEWWNAHAAPEGTYDYVLHLDSLQVYTGGLNHIPLLHRKTLIDGRGAILDLQQSHVQIIGSDAQLDIQGCVLLNGGNEYEAALSYKQLARGQVRNCVFYRNYWGLSMRTAAAVNTRVENCIFLENTLYGAMLNRFNIQPVATCLSYRNGEGVAGGADWAIGCDCPGDVPDPWEPSPSAGCLCQDPMFVRASTNPTDGNFHLLLGSPCAGTGTPVGTNIGTYQEAPVLPVQLRSWGQIKGAYRLDLRP
jgi:hypothetical protein